MNVIETIKELLHHFLDLTETEFNIHVGEESGQIMFTEIEYQIEGGTISIVGGGFCPTDFDQIDDILMFEQL